VLGQQQGVVARTARLSSVRATALNCQDSRHLEATHADDERQASPALCPQVYLGGYDTEEQAALAYDIAAIKCRGTGAITNFNVSNYQQDLAHLGEVRACAAVCCCLWAGGAPGPAGAASGCLLPRHCADQYIAPECGCSRPSSKVRPAQNPEHGLPQQPE
jgi:hypothetical protein